MAGSEKQRVAATEVAIRTKEIKVPYVLKKAMVRPVVLGIRKALIDTGDVFFMDFGRFYVETKNVSRGVGCRDKKQVVAIRFRPSKSFVKEVAERWNGLLEARIVPPEEEPAEGESQVEDTSHVAPAQSVAGGELAE